MNMNKVLLIGRVAGTPKYTPAKEKVQSRLTFMLAVNRFKSDKADFVPITCWGGTADAGAKYLTKGKEVSIDGRLRFDSEQLADGTYRNYSGVTADLVGFGNDSQKVQKEREAGIEDPELVANRLLADSKPAKPASGGVDAALVAQILAALKGQPCAAPSRDPVVDALIKKGISEDEAKALVAAKAKSRPVAEANAFEDPEIPF
ncbi:MAG: single-stranded DNA-binding protein [Dehalococcoidia bacterium]|nr:single-stranded DNA-binding protein [Dehalococcoidia bacterium]